MRIIFLILYIISLIASLAIFHFTQVISPEVSDGYAGGNGNPGLMFVMLGYPFLAFFIYGTTEYTMRCLMDKWTRKWFNPALISAAVLAAGIFIYTLWSASQVRNRVEKEIHPFDSGRGASLINPYTNDVFFDWPAFIGVLLVCYVAGGIWAKKRGSKSGRVVRKVSRESKS